MSIFSEFAVSRDGSKIAAAIAKKHGKVSAEDKKLIQRAREILKRLSAENLDETDHPKLEGLRNEYFGITNHLQIRMQNEPLVHC